MARLAEDQRTQCVCVAKPVDAPVRCLWRATAEDFLCDGCRALCLNKDPFHFQVGDKVWDLLQSGQEWHHPGVDDSRLRHLIGKIPEAEQRAIEARFRA